MFTSFPTIFLGELTLWQGPTLHFSLPHMLASDFLPSTGEAVGCECCLLWGNGTTLPLEGANTQTRKPIISNHLPPAGAKENSGNENSGVKKKQQSRR